MKMKIIGLTGAFLALVFCLCGCALTREGAGVWPVCDNTRGVPQPGFNATIAQSFDSDGVTGVVFTGVGPAQAADYLEDLKKAGFNEVQSSSEVSGSVSYVAKEKGNPHHLSYTYEKDAARLSVFFDRINTD